MAGIFYDQTRNDNIVKMEIKRIGKINSDEANKVISSTTEPIVFEMMIEDWPSRLWTVDYFCKIFGNIETKFKICRLDFCDAVGHKSKRFKPIMETDCIYVDGCLSDYSTWLRDELSANCALKSYPRNQYSCYIDYKYMIEMFKDQPEILEEVNWGVFGFKDRNGADSTLWIGSKNAFTPLHQDTYGRNLVAQLSGKKSWMLFKPEDTENLYPVRIPYEESSVFSSVNIKNPDFIKYPKFKEAKQYEVILNPGDVLFVPKHWWHFVENLEPSISVNTWIEKDCDDIDRVKEAVVRTLVSSLKESENAPKDTWLNPNEEVHPFATNLRYLETALQKLNSACHTLEGSKRDQVSEESATSDLLINCITSDIVIDVIVKELQYRFSQGR